MNGIEKITARITQEVGAEIDAIRKEGAAKAEEITARYDAAARRESEEILRRGRDAAAERGVRLDRMAEMESRQQLLATRQAAVGQAFALALSKLRQMPQQDYVALLASLAARASSAGGEQIILSATDRESCGQQVTEQANAILARAGKPAELTLSETTRDIQGGLLLAEGDVEVNCSFETLTRLIRGEIAGDVAHVLFS